MRRGIGFDKGSGLAFLLLKESCAECFVSEVSGIVRILKSFISDSIANQLRRNPEGC